ncbi:MAG TPA: hypothetical protein VG826_05710 [Pirellulales bacterium]|nr:hypothetical protein [Pirellulales bacterium]
MILLIAATAYVEADSSDRDPGANQDTQRRAEVSRVAEAEVRLLTVTVGRDRAVTAVVRPESLLRWSNPTVAAAYGEVFVWTVAGRPVALGCVYHAYDRPWGWILELVSTSERPVGASAERKTLWNTESAGVTFKLLEDAPPPSPKPAGRLSQMRKLAGRFSAEMIDERNGDEEKRSLRLLTHPVYRYSSDEEHVVDGSVFCFAEATDPEIWLLLEAVEEDGATSWRYGLARMNGSPMQVRFDGTTVHTWDKVEKPWANRSAPYVLCDVSPDIVKSETKTKGGD